MHRKNHLYFLVGPSGVGKDSILSELKQQHYSNDQPLVAHRYITRAVREGDENHIELSHHEFQKRAEAGLFLFDWESHENCYAIGREICNWVDAGQDVIVNGSRQYLATARKRYANLIPVWVTVSEEVLRQRLIERGRENTLEIEARIQRNRQFEAQRSRDCLRIHNDKAVADAVVELVDLIRNRELVVLP